MAREVRYQASLFDRGEPAIDATFASVRRVHLDERAWIDLGPGWVSAADRLFDELVPMKAWAQRERRVYDQDTIEPRLTARWTLDSGEALEPKLLEDMRVVLSRRYDVVFDSLGFNLYRDGRDSVAWHRDRIARAIAEPIVPLVSLGEPRKLMFRPRGGGPSRAFAVGHGDLLVTGGTTQRTWEHAILKVARAGARMSLAFRYGAELVDYDRDAAT